jgi:hypothetical protein
MNNRRWGVWLFGVIATTGCSIPTSIRQYATELPARADGQYAVLDEPLRKQLVMKDSELQCRIDLADGKTEADSGACRCAKSASADWTQDCKGWLGPHTPHP